MPSPSMLPSLSSARSQGGLYEMHVHLALADGHEVHVERAPPADERRADLTFALNGAFKRARRATRAGSPHAAKD